MNCSDFVARYSDFVDGVLPGEVRDAAERHLSGCESCARYDEVMGFGKDVLRSLPAPELSHDFAPRLQHRLYNVDAEVQLGDHGSGAPGLTVVGIALLLTAIAWSPVLRPGSPVVELPPIVVDRPPPSFPVRPVSAMPTSLPRPEPLSDLDGGLWDDPHALFYEYSPLSQRYRRQSALRRAGLDQDR